MPTIVPFWAVAITFWIHMLAIVASTIGVIVLLVMAVGTLPATSVMSVAIYGAALLGVFCCSAAYNSRLRILTKTLDSKSKSCCTSAQTVCTKRTGVSAEEKFLADARAAYGNGAPVPLPEEQADAEKYRQRIARLRQEVQLHERNIEALKKELGNTR